MIAQKSIRLNDRPCAIALPLFHVYTRVCIETSTCPTFLRGYHEIAGDGRVYCYYISESSDRRTWFDARQACSTRSGDLAKIYNEDIRIILKERYLTDTKYWIGLVGLVWYWANGMTVLNT